MPPLGYATLAAFAVAVIKVVVVSLVIGIVARAFLPRAKLSDFGPPARTITRRDPVAPRRIVLGDARIGGTIVYLTTTNDDKDLHEVIALCDGLVTAIDAVWVDGVAILPDDLDTAGNVVTGRFAGVMRIKKFLGAAPQTADADLVAEVEEWTDEHRLDGIAGLYVRMRRDPAAFLGGLPNISADVRGLAVPDPRDAGLRFSRNSALQQRWWLASAEWGLGAPAPLDSALSFDGVDDGVSIGDKHAFSGNSPFTVEAWIKIGATGSLRVPASNIQVTPTVDGYEWPRLRVTNTLEFSRFVNNVGIFATSTSTFVTGQLVHVAGSYNGSQLEIFIDGVSEDTTPDARSMPAFVGDLKLGRFSRLLWDSVADDFRVWNVARSAAQILANKDKRLVGNEPGLVGYWKLDEGAGLTAIDSTANGNDGTLSGGPIYVTSPFGQAPANAAASEIDDAAAVAAANLAEETVPVAVVDGEGAAIADDFIVKAAVDWFERVTFTAPLGGRTAAAVTLSTTGTLPAPLLTGRKYFVIVDDAVPGVFRLANSAEDARVGPPIAILDAGSGTHTLTHTVTKNVKDEDPIITVFTDDFTAKATPDRLLRDPVTIGWRRGDTARLATTGTLPSPLLIATDYYVIPDAGGGFQLAADYADAIAGTAIVTTGAGSGIHTVTRTAEARYAGGGLVVSNVTRKTSLEAMLTASGGRAVWLGGLWSLFGAAARSSALTLVEDDLRAAIKVATKTPRRDRFNAVQGLYHAPDQNGQPASYPKVASAAFKAADGGEEIIHNIDLPFTDSPATCQRLAKIELLRARQEIDFVTAFSLKALRLRATDWFSMTNTRFGWAAKLFECSQWQLAVDGTPPALTVRMTGHETAASDYDWATSEEQTTDPAPDTDLPSPWALTAPAGLKLVESLYETRDGAGVKSRANLSWAPALEGSVTGYEIRYRSTVATVYIDAAPVAVALVAIDDIAPDIYEFQVRSVGGSGHAGPWSEPLEAEINGLLAPPANNTGLGIQQISAVAILTWDKHPDLDVRIGGSHRIRWSPAESGAAWNTAVETADPVPGGATQVMTPLRTGSYLVRAYDSSGVPSPLATVISTRGAEQLAFTTFSTVTESPTYPGSHAGTVALDGILKLAALGLWDAIPDVDLLDDIDSFGGIGASGTYTFATGIDMGSVKTVRLSASVTATAVNVLDKIDDRTALIDTWEDFDGVPTGDADLQTYFRETDDDPGGSPTWSPYQKLTAADRNARGFEFQARLSTTDPAYNIHATALSAKAEEVV